MIEKDYPKTYTEFIDRFKDKKKCVDYIKRLRWPSGFVCPR